MNTSILTIAGKVNAALANCPDSGNCYSFKMQWMLGKLTGFVNHDSDSNTDIVKLAYSNADYVHIIATSKTAGLSEVWQIDAIERIYNGHQQHLIDSNI